MGLCDPQRNNPAPTLLAQVVSNYESNLNFAAFGPRILFALLAGYWSDKNGRKMLIGVPIFGQIATSAVFIANWALLSRLPFEALYAELVNEACGNFIVYYLGRQIISIVVYFYKKKFYNYHLSSIRSGYSKIIYSLSVNRHLLILGGHHD